MKIQILTNLIDLLYEYWLEIGVSFIGLLFCLSAFFVGHQAYLDSLKRYNVEIYDFQHQGHSQDFLGIGTTQHILIRHENVVIKSIKDDSITILDEHNRPITYVNMPIRIKELPSN